MVFITCDCTIPENAKGVYGSTAAYERLQHFCKDSEGHYYQRKFSITSATSTT